MTNIHLLRPSGDRDLDARRLLERVAWLHYLRMSRSLAETPINRGHIVSIARQRVEAAKAEFAKAWRALDEVLQ